MTVKLLIIERKDTETNILLICLLILPSSTFAIAFKQQPTSTWHLLVPQVLGTKPASAPRLVGTKQADLETNSGARRVELYSRLCGKPIFGVDFLHLYDLLVDVRDVYGKR